MTYTAIIQWMEGTRKSYRIRNKTIRGIKAGDIIQAGEIALTHAPEHCILPAISCLWFDWPQGKEDNDNAM